MPRKRRNPPDMFPMRQSDEEKQNPPVKPKGKPKRKRSILSKAPKPKTTKRKSPPIAEAPAATSRSTDAEIVERVSIVYELLVWGYSRGQIVQFGSKKWSITHRQVDDYIATARKELDMLKQMQREEQLAWAIARLTLIGQKTMRVMDYQRAISAQRELNQLLGLYAPTKMEHKLDEEQFKTVKNSLISKLEQMAKALTPEIPG